MTTVGLHILKLWGSKKMIGIISYLPNDEKIRSKRLLKCKELINFINRMLPGEPIHIVAQNYTENDFRYFGNDDLLFLKYGGGIGCANAGNVILEKFYNSSDDVLLLSDDDIKNYDYYEIKELWTKLYYGEIDSDFTVGLDSALSPFKEMNIKEDVENTFTFRPITKICAPNIYFMKNLKKKYGKEIYYSQKLIDSDCAEDLGFICELLQENFKMFCCINWIKCGALGNHYSVLNDTNNVKELTTWHSNLVKNLNLYIEQKYGVDVSTLFKNKIKYGKFKIKRLVKYELSENDIPEKMKVNNLPLFENMGF